MELLGLVYLQLLNLLIRKKMNLSEKGDLWNNVN